MASKTYCYQFSDQKVFASENAPLSFQINGNYAIVAMNNYTVGVYDISQSNFTLINLFSVCGCVIKIDYCVFDDYIITLESKDHTDVNTTVNNSVRTYHNWRNGGTQSKTRFRPALGLKLSNVSPSHTPKADRASSMAESPFMENVVDVLEFLHLNHPLCFSIYTNYLANSSTNSKMPNQNFEDIYSQIAISESTYVHIYRFCPPHRKSCTSNPILASRPSLIKSNETDASANENSFYFQHLYTVKFSFMVLNVCILSRVLVVASLDKVQAIQILEEKQKSEMFSIKMEKKIVNSISQIELDIDKCWLTSVNNARKLAAAKPKLRPKEILGPTQNLDTASITLLRYADSKEMSFETLLFRKYLIPTASAQIQNINLVKVPDFDKVGLFIVLRNEIVLYSFCLKTNEVNKIAEYDFQNETVLSMTFSDHVNLIHVAFANGDLVTYSSRLCAPDLFESNDVSKRVSLTRLGKVTLMGLTDVRSSGSFICACCKFNFFEENEIDNAVIVSPDSWNFYLFSHPLKSNLKHSIITHADHKGNKKLLQMLLCSLLVFPSKEEVNNKVIQDIIVCCLKGERFYVDLVPSLLLRNGLTILDVLNIFQILETKELYDDHLFELYAKQKLVKANFVRLNEEHFRWIVIKILQCSINLLFDVITTNNLEDFLKADLLIIEGLDPITFESIFIKILYYSAHTDYDLVEPLLAQLDQKALKKLIISQPHLIYNKKRHTSFGWALNLYSPHIYASIVVSCFLKEANDTNEFTNLELAKQVGQCSHIMVLEEFLRISLKYSGLIPNTGKFCLSKLKSERRESFYLLQENNVENVSQNEVYKNYTNQLLILYHEFSFNSVEFCPHKTNPLCRKIPLWLKSLRFHTILDQFYPFNGLNPFVSPHSNSGSICFAICCQSYLIRLQCLMSWKESSKLPGKNVIEASCESMSHPAWKSLSFLLLQQAPAESRNIPNIISFIRSLEKHKDQDIVDLYFSTFISEISLDNWKEIIKSQSNVISLNKMLKYASTSQGLKDFHQLLEALKECKVIEAKDYKEWTERSGKLCHRNELFNSLLKQII